MDGVQYKNSNESYPLRTSSTDILEKNANDEKNKLTPLNDYSDSKQYNAVGDTVLENKTEEQARTASIGLNEYNDSEPYTGLIENDPNEKFRKAALALNKYKNTEPYTANGSLETKSEAQVRDSNTVLNDYTETKGYNNLGELYNKEEINIREIIVSKNTYNQSDPYSAVHKNALGDGDEKGKDEYGSKTDIATREQILKLNRWSVSNDYFSNQPE